MPGLNIFHSLKMTDHLITGIRPGVFDTLHFLRQGNLSEINQVLDSLSGGGGGGGTVTSAQAPLSISGGGVLEIDLSAYTTTAGLNTLLANYVLASDLYDGAAIKLMDSGGTSRNLQASLNGGLVWNASQLVDLNYLTASLAGKQDTLVAGTGIAITGNTISSASGGGAVTSATAPLSISSGVLSIDLANFNHTALKLID